MFHAKLRHLYIKSIRHHLRTSCPIPDERVPVFVHVGGAAEVLALHERIFREHNIGSGSPVLIIGVFGGRDFYHCKSLGMTVTGVDLAYLPEFENDVANVEVELPYSDRQFKCVILREVLEHLWNDTRALSEVRRVLTDEGVVITAVPFYDDDDEWHVRMHSPESLKKLARACGFEPTLVVDRPGVIALPAWLNSALKLMSIISYAAFGLDGYSFVPVLCAMENRLGEVRWLRPIRKLQQGFGCTTVLQKSNATDNTKVQIEAFCRVATL